MRVYDWPDSFVKKLLTYRIKNALIVETFCSFYTCAVNTWTNCKELFTSSFGEKVLKWSCGVFVRMFKRCEGRSYFVLCGLGKLVKFGYGVKVFVAYTEWSGKIVMISSDAISPGNIAHLLLQRRWRRELKKLFFSFETEDEKWRLNFTSENVISRRGRSLLHWPAKAIVDLKVCIV